MARGDRLDVSAWAHALADAMQYGRGPFDASRLTSRAHEAGVTLAESVAELAVERVLRLAAQRLARVGPERLSDRLSPEQQAERAAKLDRLVPGDVVGRTLAVTSDERTRLRLWTIAPCDMARDEYDAARRETRRARARIRARLARARAGAVDRQTYLSSSVEQLKPWLAEGVSRRTWYRRRGVAERDMCRGTTASHQVKKDSAANGPVPSIPPPEIEPAEGGIAWVLPRPPGGCARAAARNARIFPNPESSL